MICRVRTEGFAVGQIHLKSYTVRIGPSGSRPLFVSKKACGNFEPCSAWILSRWRYFDNLTVHQLGLAFDFV